MIAEIKAKFTTIEMNLWDNQNITNPDSEPEVKTKIEDLLLLAIIPLDLTIATTSPFSVKYVWYNDTRYCIHSYELNEGGAGGTPWNMGATGNGGYVSARMAAEISWATAI